MNGVPYKLSREVSMNLPFHVYVHVLQPFNFDMTNTNMRYDLTFFLKISLVYLMW